MDINNFGNNSFVRVKGLKERIQEAEKEIQMREIKFRQAITEKDGTFRWHYWGYLHVDTAGLPVFINPLGPVEWDKRPSYQFTGLKDKNGKEIYEGDIIQNVEYKNIWVVAWDDKHAKFGYQYTTGILIDERCSLGKCKHSENIEYEIIGNIHQNPELMEQK